MPTTVTSADTASAGTRRIVLLLVIAALLIVLAVVLRSRPAHTSEDQTDLKAEALSAANARVSQNPNDPSAVQAFGEALLAEGRPSDAVIAFRQEVRLTPNSAPAHAGLGKALEASGQNDEASNEYLSALDIDPNQIDALLGAGRLSSVDNLSYTRAAFLRATEVAPQNPEGWIGLGLADEASPNHMSAGEAVKAFGAAVALHTMRTDFQDAYAQSLITVGESAQAESLMRAYLADHQDDAVAHFALGHAIELNNPTPERLTEAESQLQQACTLAPDNSTPARELAIVELQEGKVDQAIAEAQSVLKTDPMDIYTMRILAKAEGRAGETAASQETMDRADLLYGLKNRISALQAQKDKQFLNPAYYQSMADLYTQLGDQGAAQAELGMKQRLLNNPAGFAQGYRAYNDKIDKAFGESLAETGN